MKNQGKKEILKALKGKKYITFIWRRITIKPDFSSEATRAKDIPQTRSDKLEVHTKIFKKENKTTKF